MFFFFSNKLNPEPLSRGSRQYNTKKLHIFSNEFDWDAFSVLCSGRHLEILLLVFVFWCFRYCSEKSISKNVFFRRLKKNLWSKNDITNKITRNLLLEGFIGRFSGLLNSNMTIKVASTYLMPRVNWLPGSSSGIFKNVFLNDFKFWYAGFFGVAEHEYNIWNLPRRDSG